MGEYKLGNKKVPAEVQLRRRSRYPDIYAKLDTLAVDGRPLSIECTDPEDAKRIASSIRAHVHRKFRKQFGVYLDENTVWVERLLNESPEEPSQ